MIRPMSVDKLKPASPIWSENLRADMRADIRIRANISAHVPGNITDDVNLTDDVNVMDDVNVSSLKVSSHQAESKWSTSQTLLALFFENVIYFTPEMHVINTESATRYWNKIQRIKDSEGRRHRSVEPQRRNLTWSCKESLQISNSQNQYR